MGKRVPVQAVLPFGRRERVVNRQIGQRMAGVRVGPGLGRPKKKNRRVEHRARAEIASNTAVHVTVRVKGRVPNLRKRRRFNVIKTAFVRFAVLDGFRLVHFAVLSNHMHFVVEADSRLQLAKGMQKLLHSISRRLNALCVMESGGGKVRGAYRLLNGWIGKLFEDRYHAHVLASPTEMTRTIRYVLGNAAHHYDNAASIDGCASDLLDEPIVATPRGFLLKRACGYA